MTPPVYIVSGYMRSGTSMMMAALVAGGLEAVRDVERDQYIAQFGDESYAPNPSGVWEIDSRKYGDLSLYAGKLVKVFYWGLAKSVIPRSIVFMLRDPDEIHQSYEALGSGRIDRPRVDTHLLDNYWVVMRQIISELEKESEVVVGRYEEIVAQPQPFFDTLAECGWPIDPQKAAAVVNPVYYRFRKELLVHA